ncbi:ABC transporter substrate-binding protein [Sphingomonas sp. H39-1-10]|uniref:ABC transporter substrate-binding protein n=1 Tax=Sphingomonas TaxID=13687 RepID=UPI0008815B2E|nr:MULTISPECIES: ABC transporter substrate-binding protein [Sphingomonas]MDF0488731.1 ABC transporter substrate-binding protein [Sphingomonas pollutisoli]SDA13090.1 iron complex transport system substrate-binding protein [Sphingomonas sp. NFR15]
MTRRLLPILLALGLTAAAPPAHPPRRIVSLNLCADQLLVELADRGQIAGLTRNAPDAEMSAVAARTHGLHILGQSAEEILAIGPDLIVGAPSPQGGMAAVLAPHRYPVVDLAWANSYADIVAQIRQIARAVGHPARGEALIARMNRELAALPRAPGHPVAAYYQRRGYMTGTGTLVDDIMTRVGLTNLAAKLGKPALSQVSLEEMIAAKPDYLIVETGAERVVDQGTEMLHHPILDRIPRLRLPEAWTVCGGPAYVLAAQSLARQIAATR